MNRLFKTKEDYKHHGQYVTVCLDKILHHKIETYKKYYVNKLASSDVVDTCYMLIYEFLEKPETFIKKKDDESIFTTLTRAMRNTLAKDYSKIVGAVKLKTANGKRQIYNSIFYQNDFEITSEKNDEELDNKTYLDDAAYQAWSKTDNIRIPSEEYKIARQIKQDDKIFKNSPKQKEIYNLLAQGLNQKDVAGITGCSKANISQQKNKLRKKISKQYGYNFSEVSANGLEYTDLTKRIMRLLPEMEDNITYIKNIDYSSLLELLVYFEYKPEKISIERLSMNKTDQDIDFVDIVFWGLPLQYKYLFINLLNGMRLSDAESLRLYWYMASVFEEYIEGIRIHREILKNYIEYRKKFIDKNSESKI
jgi:DNA-binding CsgD family transcriptional regulator